MKTAAVSELKARLSEYLNQVKAGMEVLITDRGKPVARLVPIPRSKDLKESLVRMEKQGLIRLGSGKLPKDWQKEVEGFMEKELLDLGLLTKAQIRKQDPEKPALKKFFMHGIGHPLGLDVHDVGITTEPIRAGWVLTVEPGIYLPEEGFGVRLENDFLIQEDGNVDLLADVPIEPEQIEALVRRRKK